MSLTDRIIARMLAGSIRHVEPVLHPGPGLAAEVFMQMRSEAGLLPPLIVHAAHPKVLAAVWVLGRETWLAGPAGRLEREAVAVGVSQANRCPYCVEAHSMTVRSVEPVILPTATSQSSGVGGTALDAYARWAAASCGAPHGGAAPPYPREHAPWFVGTAVFFHYVNRVVNVLLTESPLPARKRLSGPVSGWLSERVGRSFVARPLAVSNPESGTSLRFLPEPGVEESFTWAAGDPTVSAAVARADAVFEDAGAAVLPEVVRELVVEQLEGWNGEPPGLSGAWLGGVTGGLAPANRGAADLCLLTAMASYRVTDDVVERFRTRRSSDADLVATVAWAAWRGAKRIGEWLADRDRLN